MQRWRHTINYRNTGGRWPGFARAHNFAVRWTARVRFFRSGRYRFSLISDDGSKLWINNRYTINNDGLHGWRNREATRYIRAGWTMMRVEFFERGGHHGCLFRYRGPDTGNRWKVVRAGGTRTRRARVIYRHGLWRENVFYFRQGSRVPHLANRRPNMQRWKHYINYRNTGGRWPGFSRAHNFAVRWTGRVRFFRSGHYRFSLISDDGSKLWINNRYTINNDGLHGWRNREATRYIRAGWTMMRVEFFERGGHHGCLFRYRGPDTGNRWKVVRAGGTRAARRRPSRSRGCRRGMYKKCYRPYRGRRTTVCAWVCR